jgi:hypothetical protein
MLRRYRCHKIVQAGEIKAIEKSEGGQGEEAYVRHAVLENGSRFGSKALFARGVPAVGDFIVVYDDGYVSWSPKKAFLDGYSPIDDSGADYQPAQEHP